MSLSIQFYTMIAMFGMGGFFGASLDTYNRFLKRKARRRWLVFMNDILFWILQAFILFYILLLVNEGEIRFYIFLALLCGFAAYQALLKKSYVALLEWFIRFTISVANFIWRVLHLLIFSPFKWLFLLLLTIILGLGRQLFFLVQMIGKMLLWMIKTILKPITWIGRIIWNIIPIKIRKMVIRWIDFLARHMRYWKHLFTKFFRFLLSMFKSKS